MTRTGRLFQNGRAGEDTCSNPSGRKEMLMKRKQLTKWASRSAAALLAGAMVFGGAAMAAPVQTWAADSIVDSQTKTGSLTIHKKDYQSQPLNGAEFSVYKIMDLTPGTAPGTFVKYQKDPDFAAALQQVTLDALDNYNTQQLEGLISELEKTVTNGTAQTDDDLSADQKGETAGDGSYRFDGLALGYYLVRETKTPEGYVNGNAFLVAIPSTDNYNQENAAGTEWVYDITVEPKNSVVDIEKKLGQDTDGSVTVGDLVPYTIKTTVPVYPDDYTKVTFKILDVTSDGLEILNTQEKPVQVYADEQLLTTDGNYTLTVQPVEGTAADLIVEFTEEFIRAHGNSKIEVRYWAEVTEKAVIGQTGNTNEVKLEYSNGPDSTGTVEKPPVKVYSFGINVVKFTKDGKEKPLEGATFELYKDSLEGTKIGEQTSDLAGKLGFGQLDEGTYYLKETKSPAGYTLLTNPIKVEIAATEEQGHATGAFTVKVNDQDITATTGDYTTHLNQAEGTVTVAVENHKGFTLPTTGGTGIALFLLIGAAGILTVSAVLVKKSRNAAK